MRAFTARCGRPTGAAHVDWLCGHCPVWPPASCHCCQLPLAGAFLRPGRPSAWWLLYVSRLCEVQPAHGDQHDYACMEPGEFDMACESQNHLQVVKGMAKQATHATMFWQGRMHQTRSSADHLCDLYGCMGLHSSAAALLLPCRRCAQLHDNPPDCSMLAQGSTCSTTAAIN